MSSMPGSDQVHFDATTAMILGSRDRQEDAVASDFPVGANHGFAVLSDGMGGHSAGDVASQIVVTEMFSELKMLLSAPEATEAAIQAKLSTALQDANKCIEHMASTSPDIAIMGATALVPVIFGLRLYWISVGDSPLYVFRAGTLMQLNDDHSMAPQIDEMQSKGLINSEAARTHPDRSCLTSVLIGNEIPKIDCSGRPFLLEAGDIVIAASDGLQYLSDDRIAEILSIYQARPSAEIIAALLRELEMLGDPDQDNVALCLVKVMEALGLPRSLTDTVEDDEARIPATPRLRPPAAAHVETLANSSAGAAPISFLAEDGEAGAPSLAAQTHVANTTPSVTVLSRKSGNASQVLCVSRKAKM